MKKRTINRALICILIFTLVILLVPMANINANDKLGNQNNENGNIDIKSTDNALDIITEQAIEKKENEPEKKSEKKKEKGTSSSSITTSDSISSDSKLESVVIASDVSTESGVIYAEDESQVIVETFAQMQNALSQNNGITTVYLGANIPMEASGIVINPAKTEVTINGTDPTTSNRYTLTDYYGSYADNRNYTIQPGSNSIERINVININLDGYNQFGPISTQDAYTTYLYYDNINYNGPQFSFAGNGTVHVKNSVINLPERKNINSTPTQELAECNRLLLEGTVEITKANVGTDSFLWLKGNNAEFRVLESSEVQLGTGRNFIYSTAFPLFTIETNASCSVESGGAMIYSGQALSGLNVENNADFSFLQTSNIGTGNYSVGVAGDIRLNPGSTFDIRRTNSSAIGSLNYLINYDGTSGRGFYADNPGRVTLINGVTSNTAYGVIRFINSNNTVSIDSKGINIWTSVPSFLSENMQAVDPMDSWNDSDLPEYVWNKKELDSFNVTAVINSNNSTSSVNAPSYSPATNNNTQNFTTGNFAIGNTSTKMMTFGNQELNIDDVYNTANNIGLTTQSNSYITASYINGTNENQRVDGFADSRGRFNGAIGETGLLPGSSVSAMSQNNFLRVYEEEPVETETGVLRFLSVPEELPFGEIPLPEQNTIIPRSTTNWSISVEDTRNTSNVWKITAGLEDPLTASEGGIQYTLPDALVYITDDGEEIFREENIPIYNGNTGNNPITIITWPDNRGPLLSINTRQIKAGLPYSTTINWTLTDGP